MNTRKRSLLVLALLLFGTIAAAEEPSPKAWLGMGLLLKKSPDGSKFLYVAAVPGGTPAAKAGMAVRDVITMIDKKPISFRDDLDLMEFTAALKPDQVVRFRVTREGKARTIEVKASELPPEYEERARLSMERARAARESRGARSQ